MTYKSLNRGDIELILRCLDYSKKNILDQRIDADEPKELRDAARAWREEELARIEALINKLRLMRDQT
ncbi:MAG: hypothetical protein QOK48_597 [Blastocatellia bacterium]|jgi:ribosome assembly protein YihI (activator of Der GTPase)|nr:hypothetical protein [Blastocatellia bacterium]